MNDSQFCNKILKDLFGGRYVFPKIYMVGTNEDIGVSSGMTGSLYLASKALNGGSNVVYSFNRHGSLVLTPNRTIINIDAHPQVLQYFYDNLIEFYCVSNY